MTDFQPSGPRTLAERLARFFRLVQKELRENLRDRRTIITLVLMPVLLYPLLGVASRQFFLAAGKTLEQQPFRIVAENESAALLIGELLRESGKLTGVRPDQPAPPPRPGEPPLRPDPSLNFSSDVADVAASVGLGIDVAVLLREAPSGPLDVSGARDAALDVQLVFDPASPMSVEAANWLEDALLSAGARILDRRLRQLRVSQRPLPVVVLRRPLEAKERNTTSPLLVLAPLVLVLMTITGAVYPAIDLTAGERERGTLEVLCAAPAGRMSLLGAKYVTVVTTACLTAAVNLVMMGLTLWGSGLGRVLLPEAARLPGVIAILCGLLVLLAAFFSAVLLALASLARSFKEAQAYLVPLMVASFSPGLVVLAPDLKLTPALAAAPLLNVVLLGREALAGRAEPATATITVAATLLYAIGAVAVAARLFGSESVLYGEQLDWSELFRRPTEEQSRVAPATALGGLAVVFPLSFALAGVLLSMVNGTDARQTLILYLIGSAAITAIAYAAWPAWLAWMSHVRTVPAFSLALPRLAAWPAAVLWGGAWWMLAHELVVAQHDLGFIRLDDKLARAAQFAETLRGVPVALVLLAIAVAPGVCEELFFRGFLQTALEAPARDGRPRRWTAFFTTATAFAAFHLFNPLGFTPERFLPSLLLGLALGLLRLASGSTWPGILMHVLNNGLAISADRLGLDLGPAQSALLSVVHLPAAWLAAGAGMILLGAGLVALARPRPAPAASEPAAPPPESIP